MKYIGSNIGFIFTKIKELMNSHNTSTSAHSELFKSWVILNSPTNAEIVNAIAAIYKKGVGDVLVNENSGDATKLFFRPSIATVEIPVFGEPTETLKETKGIYITTSGEQGQYIASHTDGTLTLTPAASDAVLYTPQTLTEEQQEQARTNIGAGQPVFAVNVTEAVESGGYTADKTAAEIEAAYQAGRTIVCKMQARFVIGYIPVELPLVSRNQGRDFSFAGDQLVQGNWILATTVNISDSRVEVFNNMVEIYEKPDTGIPKSDLEQSVQTSLARADTSISYDSQTLTEAQQKQARANIGALDVNIETTPVDIGVGSGSRVYYVKSGWLKPCPDNADKELILQYRRVFELIGSQALRPSSDNILLHAKSAYALYQKGLASESIEVTNDPLRAAQVYVTWNITTRSNKHYFHYAQVSTAYNYNCTYCVEDDALTSEIYQRAIYCSSNGVGEQDSVSQFRMHTNPTEDMHIATKQYVDTAKTEAQQLGLTAATPGQIIKVKAVQDGKPTEWEAVDDRLPKVSPSDAGKVLGVEQIGEFEYSYGLTHMPTLSDFIPLGITNASPGQFAKVSFVDDFGGPTAWEAADIYEKPDTGIPKSDLADDVQTSLAKADTAISYDSQTLTDAQKQQARTNIGAVKCSVEGNRLILTT